MSGHLADAVPPKSTPTRMGLFLVRLPPTDVLAGLAGLSAVLMMVGFAQLDFSRPVSLSGDHIFLLQMIKDAMRGVGVFNEHMGAPLRKNGFYMPLFDGSYKFVIWLLTRFASNVFLVVNLFYLVGVATMFATCFWSLRMLSIEPWLASVAGIGFVLTPYFATRSFSHDLLALYYSVPMGGALAILLANGDPVRKARSVFAVAAMLVIGTSGLYYAFFSAMFIGITLTTRAVRERSFKPLLLCAGICVALLILLLASAYGYHVWRWLLGGKGLVSPPRRWSWEQLSHGSLPSTALHVYADIGIFADRFADYKSRISSGRGMGDLPGESYLFEWPGPFLTSIVLSSPALLFFVLNARSPRTRMIATCIAFVTFGLIFSIRGGLGYVFNFVFGGAIRGQERIMPFLTFFAVVVACLTPGCFRSRHLRTLAAAIVMVGLLSGTYSALALLPHRQRAFLKSEEAQSYETGLLNVLVAKDGHGIKMVFQLPVMQWPESPPSGKLVGYEHALPYIFDRNDSGTRWSYGLSSAEIQKYVALVSNEADLPESLKQLGFDGILVEKTGYSPEKGAALVEAIGRNGGCAIYEDRFRTFFSICR